MQLDDLNRDTRHHVQDNVHRRIAVQSRDDWDPILIQLGGHLLQSWRWGELRERRGWHVERLLVQGPGGVALAQVLIRPQVRRLPYRIAYLPRGPVIRGDNVVAIALAEQIDEVCKRHRAVALIVEPSEPLPSFPFGKDGGFLQGPISYQPAQTLKVALDDDESILRRMRPSTRHDIRHAGRKGVIVVQAPADIDAIQQFYDLLDETAKRQKFGTHPRAYFEQFLEIFGDDAALLFAEVGQKPAATMIAVRFGTEAIYLFGGSSTHNRVPGAAASLQFHAMRWARDSGCLWYDLWGTEAQSQARAPRFSVLARAKSARPDMGGITRFKRGFGGQEVILPVTLAKHYEPFLGKAATTLMGLRSSPGAKQVIRMIQSNGKYFGI